MTIKRDRRWVVPFLIQVSETNNRPAAELVRRAFILRFTERQDDPLGTRSRTYEKQNWRTIQLRVPPSMAWLSESINAEAQRQGRSPSDVLFIAFCEVYGEQFPELREKYEKWKELNLTEAA